jgi:hypothetical protein
MMIDFIESTEDLVAIYLVGTAGILGNCMKCETKPSIEFMLMSSLKVIFSTCNIPHMLSSFNKDMATDVVLLISTM